MADEEEGTVEERASLIGWNPKGAKSAEEYLDGRNRNLGIANDDIKKLEAGSVKMAAELAQTNQTLDAMSAFMAKNHLDTQTERYDHAINGEKAKMQEAVDGANTEEFNEARQKVDAYEKKRQDIIDNPVVIAPKKEASDVDDLGKAILAHRGERPELFDTAVKQKAWIEELQHQGNLDPSLSIDDVMAKADKVMTKTQNMPGPLGGGDAPGAQGGESMKFSQIPKADQDVYHRFAKKMPDYTKDQYMEQYNQ